MDWIKLIHDPEHEGECRVVDIVPEGTKSLAGDEECSRVEAIEVEAVEGRPEFSEVLRSDGGIIREVLGDDFVKKVDEKARTVSMIASTEKVDRDGDIIRVSGWNLKHFRKNPLILWMHGRGQPPIGRATEIVRDLQNKRLELTAKFADAEMNPFADSVFRMLKAKFLQAGSVGFFPLKMRRPDEDERVELKLGRYGVVFEKQELLEHSIVTVPSNRDALTNGLVTGLSKGLFSGEDLQQLDAHGAPSEIMRVVQDIYADVTSCVVKNCVVENGSGGYVSPTLAGGSTATPWQPTLVPQFPMTTPRIEPHKTDDNSGGEIIRKELTIPVRLDGFDEVKEQLETLRKIAEDLDGLGVKLNETNEAREDANDESTDATLRSIAKDLGIDETDEDGVDTGESKTAPEGSPIYGDLFETQLREIVGNVT